MGQGRPADRRGLRNGHAKLAAAPTSWASGKRLGRNNQNSGIDAMEAKSALAEVTGARIEAQKTFIDGVFEMRRHMSADEWRTAFGNES